MVWTITPSGGTGITLPINPESVEERRTADVMVVPIPGGDLPFIISSGIDSVELTVSGKIYVQGQTSSYIETTYLIPLRNCVYKLVTVSADDTRYDGDYIMVEFVYSERAGIPAYFEYTMKLIRGSEMVVI